MSSQEAMAPQSGPFSFRPPLSYVRPKTLLTPRRYDLAVKYRFFRQLRHGGDPDAWRVYLWHIEKRSGARMRAGLATDKWKTHPGDYVSSSMELLQSMAVDGFDPAYAIPLDPNGELLGGAHRVACALALDKAVIVEHLPQAAWAPAWGRPWFVRNGMDGMDLMRLDKDWAELTDV